MNLFGKRVLVTGASSMIAGKTIPILENRGAKVIPTYHKDVDLTDQQNTYWLIYHAKPDAVLHLATWSGNARFNQKYPAETFLYTTQMGINVLRYSKIHGVKKVLSVLSSCCIADLGDKVLTESDIHKGEPNPSIASHGYAKRNLEIFSRFLWQQYDFNANTCILQNSFGPNDELDISKTKVVMALIKRFVEAEENNIDKVELWGTGKPRRSLIYSKDAAECLVQLLENYDEATPINIDSDQEVTIKELAETIKSLVGYKGRIEWLPEKGDGQMRKKLDSSRLREYCTIHFTPLAVALKETIDWYKECRKSE